MRKVATLTDRTVLAARLGLFISAVLFLAVFIAPRASMQEGSGQALVNERANPKLTRAIRQNSKGDEATPAGSAAAPLAPEVASNYVFATATNASLTDMSAGTATLVAADTDDSPASSLTNIGFDFYFQGARFTQFSVNANGILSLGATAQTASPYQPLAQAGLSIITPYGGDQRTHAVDGKVHFKVIGAAPNRTLIVEWLNMQSNFNSGGTADLTYQARLSETSGVIEFVYGSMTMSVAGAADVESQDPNIGFSSSNTAGTVGSVTAAQSGAPPPTFDGSSATAVANLYTAGTITVLNSAAQGSRRIFSFTPPVPTAPTGLAFTGVTATTMTVNWTDSPNETLYAVYRSTDGINFSFFNTAAQNATSINASGLNPSTTYFWQVYAVSEGALSTALAGSQTTAAAGNIVSTGAGGNWSNIATWVGGVVPTAGDNVTIVDGATVTIDVTTATCLNLTVGQGTSGILQYIATPASTLTVNADTTVAAGGTFTAGAGVLLTHILNLGGSSTASTATGNLTVNGTFDMNTTAGVITNFFGTTNATLSGAGATADFFSIVGQKGTTQTAILDVTRVITINVPAASANRLSVTGGTIKISSATVATPWFGSQTINTANGRLWINNAAASLQCVGTGVSATGGGSPTITGQLQVTAGTFGYGQGNNTMTVNGTLTLDGAGAVVNQFGAVTFAANSTLNMTAGNINIDPQNVVNIAATTNLLRFTGPNTVSATGGTITIVDPHAATGTGRALSISTGSGSYNFAGNTIRFGDGVSTTAGSVDGFDIDTFVGASLIPIGNVIVDNTATNAATRFVRVNTALAPLQMFILGDLTITNSGGSRFNLNGNLVAFAKDIVNNGTLDGSTAASRLYWIGNGVASNYSGTGTITSPLVQMDMDNPLGTTINPAVSQIILSTRINFFRGTLTNSNKVTFGTGAALPFDLQYGVAGGVTPGGNLDQSPVFNLGTGIYTVTYAQESVGRTTAFEFPGTRTINVLSVNNTNNVTLAGGDLTLSSAAAAATFTNGRFISGANNLILSSGTATVARTNGYVDGNFRKNYAAAVSKSFEVGTANGFSPVTVNATAGTFPADFTVKAVQGPQPNVGAPQFALQRYWSLSTPGAITATLTFNYLDPTDIPITANENVFVIFKYNGSFSTPGGSVTPASNTATIAGVSSFSDWTLAQPNAPTAANGSISGVINTPDGHPVGGVSVNLSGSQSGRTITNGQGQYRFSNVETSGFYTVTPGLANYSFSPSSRSFALLGNRTDAGFTAAADGTQTENPLNFGDFFVRQQYLDFLGREPDQQGWLFWTEQLNQCGIDANCIRQKRIDISAAFFQSDEFQLGGNYVYRMYRAALGRRLTYAEFSEDRQQVVGGPGLDASRIAFADTFVTRPEFVQKYQNINSGEVFVDALLQTVQQDAGLDLTSQRESLLQTYNAGADPNHSRSAVLRTVAESTAFKSAVYNASFVLTEYFGYLRRGPDADGYNFWVEVLNHRDPGNYRGMVCSFLTSAEYQERFSSVVVHGNNECGR